ncbi:MAG TPA: trypsin-like peptidase domain-containing protein [Chloroflexia bacterium]|nr:trypsin-like peptidase domain-containing protein [Chloroflexia bacterium]
MNLTHTHQTVADRRNHRSMLVSLLLAGSLLLTACDMGDTNTPAPSGQTPPTAAQQQPANNNQGGGSGFVEGGDFNGGVGTTAGSPTADNGPAVIAGDAGGSKIAAQIPIVGADPAQQPIVAMVQKVGPAVVTVVSTISGGEARGSGAIIDQQGYIVTNNHVVEGAQRVRVIFSNGKVQEAQLIGTARNNDLAVLKITGTVPAVITLGDSNKLMPGEVVVAIGSALGEFRDTVTVGVVSGLHRSLPEGNGVEIQDLIQTDAAINHGNSGGPLLNLAGELVGINTLGVTDAGQGEVAQGLGFAIPSHSVNAVVSQIIRGGGGAQAAGVRPYLGVTIQPVDERTAGFNNLVGPDGQLLTEGELVTKLSSSGPAQQAGVQVGDVIIGVNDQGVGANNRLGDMLLNFKAGDVITLVVIRGGKQGTIKVTLGSPPQ